MADRALSTSRRALLGAAASLPVLAISTPVRPEPVETKSTAGQRLLFPSSRTLWNQRLARYRRLAARAEAAAETGWFRAANDRYAREAADPAADKQPPSPASTAPKTSTGTAAPPRCSRRRWRWC